MSAIVPFFYQDITSDLRVKEIIIIIIIIIIITLIIVVVIIIIIIKVMIKIEFYPLEFCKVSFL